MLLHLVKLSDTLKRHAHEVFVFRPSSSSVTSGASRESVLLEEALRTGAHLILCADSGSSLAVDVMTLLARGRGADIPHLLKPAQDFNNAVIVRPLIDVMASEISHYYHLFPAPQDKCYEPDEENDSMMKDRRDDDGLQAIIKGIISSFLALKEFISGLESNYPSTASAVIRTGQRIPQMPCRCPGCKRPRMQAACDICDSK